MDKSVLLRRCRDFASQHGITLGEELGAGVQGIVFSAKSQGEEGRLAVKIHHQEAGYLRERDAYLRLQAFGVTSIRDCNVPELLAHDDVLWILVMTVVVRPFVLDFGGAYLDEAPDFSEEVMADWRIAKQEQFGPRWRDVQVIIHELQTLGIYLLDVNPGNIAFGDQADAHDS